MFTFLKMHANGRSLAWTCLKAVSVPSRRACAFVKGDLWGFMHTCLLSDSLTCTNRCLWIVKIAMYAEHAQESALVFSLRKLRQDPPPLNLSFWSFLTFLHHGIEEVERHLL